MKSLSCLFVGVENRGEHILRIFTADARFTPAGLVDKGRDIATAKARHMGLDGVPCFGDLGEALERVNADGCVITSPAKFHGEQIRAALEAGLHVFVAKPMTYDLDEANDLVCLAERSGLALVVDHQQRHLETERALRRYVQAGTYGPLGHIAFTIHRHRPKMASFTGANPYVWEQGVHSFDSLTAILDRGAKSVLAIQHAPPWTAYNGPTTAMGVIEFEGDLYCSYLGTFESRNHTMEIRFDFQDAAVRAVAQNSWFKRLEVARPGGDFEPAGVVDGSERNVPERYNVDAFYRAATSGGRVKNDGRENLRTLAIVEAFIRSTRTGRREEVRRFDS